MSKTKSGLRKVPPPLIIVALLLTLLVAVAAPISAAGIIRVDGDAACVGLSGQANPYGVIYCNIQDAVRDAVAGDIIHVYPLASGVYPEAVDLSLMGTKDGTAPAAHGNITLITVDDAGNPTPGTVTVHKLDPNGAIHTSTPFDGDVTIDGFNVDSDGPGIDVEVNGGASYDRNVVIQNVTANGTGANGIVASADGNVSISDCQASGNTKGDGIRAWDIEGDLTITDCVTNQNAGDGINVGYTHGAVNISGCTANGNLSGIDLTKSEDVTMTDCTVNENQSLGIILSRCWNVAVRNCTVSGNGRGGVYHSIDPDITFSACIVQGNQGDGIFFSGSDEPVAVRGSIICDNTPSGLKLASPITMDATGDWWGDASGPFHPVNNPGGSGDTVVDGDNGGNGTVSFDPWIETISPGATLDSVTVGEATVISFQFSGYGGTPAHWVYLGQGPGDLRGPAPFTLTTDNGSLTDSDQTGNTVEEFILYPDGTLQVTLIPDTVGTATVTLVGPCGLQASKSVHVLQPGIDIEKYVSVDDQATWQDADDPTGPLALAGSDVYFRLVVTNGGDAALTGITLADTDFDVSGCAVTDPLNPGDSFECVVGPVTAAEGQHTNTATVTAWLRQDTYQDEDPANYLGFTEVAVQFVPEPGSILLLACGLMGLAGYAGLRLRKR